MSEEPAATGWKGRGRTPVTRHRAGLILAALADADRPLTTQEVAKATRLHYPHVYQDLRRMCGSHTDATRGLAYSDPVSAPGFPVVWNHWGATTTTYVTWELVPEYRTERHLELALLSAAWGDPDRGGA